MPSSVISVMTVSSICGFFWNDFGRSENTHSDLAGFFAGATPVGTAGTGGGVAGVCANANATESERSGAMRRKLRDRFMVDLPSTDAAADDKLPPVRADSLATAHFQPIGRPAFSFSSHCINGA